MHPATAVVADIVAGIAPYDDLKNQHITMTLGWLGSTDDIFRRVKPETPTPHLVSHVVLVDPDERGIYLSLHRKAGLHRPMGGHVEPGEHPLTAARREAGDELGVEPIFDVVGEQPLFLTRTTTVGQTAGHEDVSLWFVVRGERARLSARSRRVRQRAVVGPGRLRTSCDRSAPCTLRPETRRRLDVAATVRAGNPR